MNATFADARGEGSLEERGWLRQNRDMTEMHAHTSRRLDTGFDSEPRYTGLYNPRWLPIPDENTLKMNVEVEKLRLEILFSEPPSPRRSQAAGTGLCEPGVPHAVTKQTEQEKTFPFQADVDGSPHINCTSSEQEGTISLQAYVGVRPKTTTTTAQVSSRAVCEIAEEAAPVKGDSTGCRASQAV